MVKNSQFFGRHVKTRIALQLVLDGLPFFSLCGVISCFGWMWSADNRVMTVISAVLLCVSAIGFVFAVPLLLIAARMRDKADDEFDSYPICKIPSMVFRCLSFIAAAFSVPAIFALIGTLL